MNSKIKEKLMKLSKDELVEYYKRLEMLPLFRLNYISQVIERILDIKQVVEKHKEELLTEENKAIVESGKFEPTQFLGEYVILEISSFYSICHKYKTKKKYDLPDMPTYWDKLKNFRNNITGHRDDNEELNSITDWMAEYETIDSIGMDNILKDFLEYNNKIKPFFGKRENEIPKN